MEANYTRLLGLALRGGNLVTGSDAVASAISAGTARLILLSADASVRTCKDAELWAERGNCLLVALPCDKAELGGALGRGSVAVAALTDTGLAAAVGERLALYDADRYGAVAERLRLKSKRAAERRTAHARARPDTPRKRKSAVPRKRDEKRGTETPPSVASRRGGEMAPRNERTKTPPSVASRRHLHPKGGDMGASASRKWENRPDGAAPHTRKTRSDDTAPRKRTPRPDGAASRGRETSSQKPRPPVRGQSHNPTAEKRPRRK